MADQQARMSRGWRIVLVISLALNMAVIGIVAGFALRGNEHGPPQRFDLSLGPIGAALSKEERRDIGRALRDNPDLRRGGRQGNGAEALADLVTALRQDPLDEGALRAAASAPASRMMDVQRAASSALADRVIAMTPAERAAFADRIEEMAGKRRR